MTYTYYQFRCVVCKKFVTEMEYFDIEGYGDEAFGSCDDDEGIKHCGKAIEPIPFRGEGEHPDDDDSYFIGSPIDSHGGR